MNTIDENNFPGIGKKMPYTAPDGFFEQISETILQKAKQRELIRKKYLFLWQSVAVAASLVGIALLGYNLSEPKNSGTEILTLQEKRIDSVQMIQLVKKVTEKPVKEEIEHTASIKSIEKDDCMEGINDVLADLSDDELLQLAATYKSDPFMYESE